MPFPRHFLRLFAFFLVLSVASQVSAQNVSPSHVYQVVDNINGELALLHEANDSSPKDDKKAPALTDRQPRHVFQKAREVFQKLQALRKINGLPESTLPPFPVREVQPADVKQLVDRILADLNELRGSFGVSKPSPSAALPSGKTPTDVYGHLAQAGRQIDGLGIPKIVPNDVYVVALTIIGDLKQIRAACNLGAVAMQIRHS